VGKIKNIYLDGLLWVESLYFYPPFTRYLGAHENYNSILGLSRYSFWGPYFVWPRSKFIIALLSPQFFSLKEENPRIWIRQTCVLWQTQTDCLFPLRPKLAWIGDSAYSPIVERSSRTLVTRVQILMLALFPGFSRIYRRYALSGKRRSRRRRDAIGDFGKLQICRCSVLRRCS
jgi:hypothetical protein